MIIGACWSQVQYRAMLLMPWVLMLRGATPASKGVLLDYGSDWIVTALFKSLRKSHFLVSLPILGTLLVSGLTVFSTGLFAMKNVPVHSEAKMQITQAFNGSSYDPRTVDSRAAAIYMAADQYNATLPVGIAGEYYAFPQFHDFSSEGTSDMYRENYVYSAEADTFSLDLDCDTAPISEHNGSITASHPGKNCSFEYGMLYTTMPDENSSYPYTLNGELGGCDGQRAQVNSPSLEPFDARTVDWQIWLLGVKRDPNGIPVLVGNKTQNFAFTSLMCTPLYRLGRGLARIQRANDSTTLYSSVDIHGPGKPDSLPGVTAGDIVYGTWRSIQTLGTFEFIPVNGVVQASSIAYWLVSSKPNEIEPFFRNGTLLSETIKRPITSIAANLAHQYLLGPSSSTIQGTVNTTKRRLYVRDLSFGLMTGILVLFIAISVLLGIFYFPVRACSRDPGSVAGLATILARSPQFMSEVMGMGSKPDSELEALLADRQHSTVITDDGTFSVTPYTERALTNDRTEAVDSIEWWRPLSAKMPMRILTFVTPLALIAALEALYQHSRKSGGIATIQDEESYIRYTWAYIPALAMLIVRILFFNLEFSARTLLPYSALRQGGTAATTSILEDKHRKIAIYGFFDALRKKQWALAAAILSVLVSFILPIAVSGLYNTKMLTLDTGSNLTQTGQWSIFDTGSGPYYASQSQSNLSSPLILYLNVSYPQWTYHDLALPHVVLSTDNYDNSNAYVDARIPALRGNPNCDIVPSNQYNTTTEEGQLLLVSVNDVDGCGFAKDDYIYAVIESPWGYFSGVNDRFDKTLSMQELLQPGYLHCPTRLFAFGRSNSTSGAVDMNVLKCRPHIEQIEVDVRFSLPSFKINELKPPSIILNSNRTLLDAVYQTGGQWVDIFPSDYRMEDFLPIMDLPTREDHTSELSGTYIAAIYGANGTQPDDLLDPDKHEKALLRVYGTVIAQLLNNAWNNTPSDTRTIPDPPARTHSATLHYNRLYLVQSAISTRILEAVLAVMVVCGVVAITFMDKRQVLPKNPGSIAAVASLLAGSEMLEAIPKGSEWCSDKTLEQQAIFAEHTFSMGWWCHESRVNSDDIGTVDSGSQDGDECLEYTRFGIDADNMATSVSVLPKSAK